ILQASPGEVETGGRGGVDRNAGRIADFVSIRERNKVRHIQGGESRTLCPLQWPDEIRVLVPIRQPGDEVDLRRPDDAVVHRPVIFETLQQHVIEAGRAKDFSYRQSGEAVEQVTLLVAALAR